MNCKREKNTNVCVYYNIHKQNDCETIIAFFVSIFVYVRDAFLTLEETDRKKKKSRK
jgi:hypothetical protein